MQFTEDTGVTGFSPEIENKFDELKKGGEFENMHKYNISNIIYIP